MTASKGALDFMRFLLAIILALFSVLPAAAYDEKQTIIAVQEALVRLGYDPGAIDGQWGGKTRTASLVNRSATTAIASRSWMLACAIPVGTIVAVVARRARPLETAPDHNEPVLWGIALGLAVLALLNVPAAMWAVRRTRDEPEPRLVQATPRQRPKGELSSSLPAAARVPSPPSGDSIRLRSG